MKFAPYVLQGKCHPEILTGHQTREGWENKPFSSFMCQYLENGTGKSYEFIVTTNRKLHMRFLLTSRSMTLDERKLL